MIAEAYRKMVAAGMSTDDIAEMLEILEEGFARPVRLSEPERSKGAARQARYRERHKASQSVTCDDSDASNVTLTPSLSEGFPLSPEPPISNPKPIPPTPPIVPPAHKSAGAYPEAFEAAWRAYPHAKGRSSKPKTMAEWRRLPTATRDLLPGAAARYGREGNEPRADCGAPAFERWIRDARFVDWLPGPDPPTVAVTPEILARRMRHFEETGEWREPWGPRPPKDRAA